MDFPIFTQTEDVPDEMLINIDEADLTDGSKKKLKEYTDQNVLTLKTLRDNSYISLSKQLALARAIEEHIDNIHRIMCWTKIPNANQLRAVCALIWSFLKAGTRWFMALNQESNWHIGLIHIERQEASSSLFE